MLNRRDFLAALSTPFWLGSGQFSSIAWAAAQAAGVEIPAVQDGEDLFSFILRQKGRFDPGLVSTTAWRRERIQRG